MRLKDFFKRINNLRPMKVKRMFQHIHSFEGYDKELVGFKYAIYYGRLYFERSKYKSNGMLDTDERSERLERIFDEYRNPTNWLEYIKTLKDLKQGLLEANAQGLIGCRSEGRDEKGRVIKYDKIENARYQQALDSLDMLIPAVTIYPRVWRRCFLPHS